ncbi:MAG TPA: TetR/AcrR family transcriptional regulator [Kineosporiaceae bacterium]
MVARQEIVTQEPDGPRAAHRARVRDLLLDAAEELFADRGFYGASVRDITDLAGTRVAAVTDYFGGKENLFRDVVLRRQVELNEDRRARIAALRSGGSRQQRVAALVEAFGRPLLERAGDRGWRNYFRLAAQLGTVRHPVLLLVAAEYNDVAADVMAHLNRIYPDASEAALHDAFLFLVSVTLQAFAVTRRLDVMTGGRLRSADVEARYSSLIPFAAGGLAALAQASS